MALKQAGSRSVTDMLTSGLWSLVMISILVSGHLVLAYLGYIKFIEPALTLQNFADYFQVRTEFLYVLLIMALLLDVWIYVSARKERTEVRRR